MRFAHCSLGFVALPLALAFGCSAEGDTTPGGPVLPMDASAPEDGSTAGDGSTTEDSGLPDGGSTDGGGDAGNDASMPPDAGEDACVPITDDGSQIGVECAGNTGCPAGYTCKEMNGIILQHLCEILCQADCECPAGFTCEEFSDKVGTWTQCTN